MGGTARRRVESGCTRWGRMGLDLVAEPGWVWVSRAGDGWLTGCGGLWCAVVERGEMSLGRGSDGGLATDLVWVAAVFEWQALVW